MRAEIRHLQTAAVPELSLQAGAPLIHAGRGLMPGVGVNRSCGGRGRTDTGGAKRVGQAGGDESGGPDAIQLIVKRWVKVQERIAIRLVRVVIDAATAPEHSLVSDAIGEPNARRPVVV